MRVIQGLIAAAFLCLFPLAVAGAAREENPETRRAILEVDKRFREALMDHDEAALRDLLAEDYRWVGNSGQVSDKADLLRVFRRWRWTIYERTDIAIQDLGSAVMMTALTNKNEQHSTSVEIFRKENGRWRLAFLQTTPRPASCSAENLYC